MILSSAEKMRFADSEAIHVRGIPSALLMERAAEGILQKALSLCPEDGQRCAAVFSGPGNNGGDGTAVAGMLLRRGWRVRAFLVGSREKMTEDHREMERRLREPGGCLEDFSPENEDQAAFTLTADLVIDAIFGIGLQSAPREPAASAIALINRSGGIVVSADIASGVSADTGEVPGAAVRAAATVTFSMAKPGHYIEPGGAYAGNVSVHDIGIPTDLLNACGTDVSAVLPGEITLPKRNPLSHKGDYGKVLLFGGSVGYTGAPSLCAQAAVRSGAGLVYLGVPESIYTVTAVKNDEAMPFPLPADSNGRLSAAAELPSERLADCDVCAAGPGMGRSDGTYRFVRKLIQNCTSPLVLDADALWAVSQDMDILKQAAAPLVLTPHAGEYARLGGDINEGRLRSAVNFAVKYGVTLVLKGHHTLCAFPDGTGAVCTRGNPGMAKGGCGDVLTGVLASILAQYKKLYGITVTSEDKCPETLKKAVNAAVYLHAFAGDLSCRRCGEYGMTPVDMIRTLPQAAKKMEYNIAARKSQVNRKSVHYTRER